MNFDLRMPIGLIFTFYGLVLVLYGLLSDPAVYKKSLGLNVNRDWGLLLLVFGLWMLIMALRAQRKARRSQHQQPQNKAL
jgi:ABC-type nickel/cobalt efflux system permease component RcnA